MAITVRAKAPANAVDPFNAWHVYELGLSFDVLDGVLLVLGSGGRRIAVYSPGQWFEASVDDSLKIE